MKLIEHKSAMKLHAARAIAAAALGVLFLSASAYAAPLYYPAPSSSTEIIGNAKTDYFTAKVHLVECNHQLMLTNILPDNGFNQYTSHPYTVAFDFKGNGWSAEPTTPIDMKIYNSVTAEGFDESTIQARVNFKTTELGQTQTRIGVATLHLSRVEGFWSDDQVLALEIIDAKDPSITLYNSSNEFAMESADEKTAYLPLTNGEFNLREHNLRMTNLVMYQAQIYNSFLYVGTGANDLDKPNPAKSLEAISLSDFPGNQHFPLTQILMEHEAPIIPATYQAPAEPLYHAPVTQISVDLSPAPATIIPASYAPSPLLPPRQAMPEPVFEGFATPTIK